MPTLETLLGDPDYVQPVLKLRRLAVQAQLQTAWMYAWKENKPASDLVASSVTRASTVHLGMLLLPHCAVMVPA